MNIYDVLIHCPLLTLSLLNVIDATLHVFFHVFVWKLKFFIFFSQVINIVV
jgi:hypothetical protein